MEPDRELLDRFVDGELSPRETERVAALMAEHPAWNDYVRKQEGLRSLLRAPLPGLDEPVPERLIHAALTAPVSWRWRLRHVLGADGQLRRLAPIGMALAAGLVIGIALRPQGEFSVDGSGQMLARGDLGRALDTKLAVDNEAGAAPRLGISFRNKSGQDCRTFSSGENAGLACHRSGGWVIETLARNVSEDAGAAYRMAGSEMPDAVRRAVTASIADEPFDAPAEARARAGGWQGR
jgi:hypothetical protein